MLASTIAKIRRPKTDVYSFKSKANCLTSLMISPTHFYKIGCALTFIHRYKVACEQPASASWLSQFNLLDIYVTRPNTKIISVRHNCSCQ